MWTLYPDGSVRRASDGVTFLPDPSSDLPVQVAYQQWLAAGNSPTPLAAPVTVRSSPLDALLDPLSVAQRASITVDHMERLEAEPANHPGGLLPITNSKVARAAGDLGLTPDAWFKLASC